MFKTGYFEDIRKASKELLRYRRDGDEVNYLRAKKQIDRLVSDLQIAKGWGCVDDTDEPFNEIP